jgi:acetoin utilization protein AcuB
MKQELVRDWMTDDVVTVTPDTTLPEAHRLMTDNQIRRLPVMDDGRLVGIITRGDVRGAEPSDATSLSIWELQYLIAKIKVKEIMTHDPITISQDVTIGEAAQVMLDNKISGLPVVDGQGRVVGIITESDIFRIVVQEWKEQAASLSHETVMVGASPIL